MKKKPKKECHTTIRDGNLFCTHCGQEHIIEYPCAIDKMIKATDYFEKLHEDCRKVWSQPEADLSKSLDERIKWWTVYGEHGTSSNTIWTVITTMKGVMDRGATSIIFDYKYLNRVMIPPTKYSHPQDPDDFRRCYLLLKAIPEWRNELHLMNRISPVWEKLVYNWDNLTKMLEEAMKNNGDAKAMNGLMQTLGC
jgi:hypothetical protein